MNNILLVIGYVWPEPNSSAAGSRMMEMLRLFKSRGWRIVFASPAQRTDYMVDLAAEDIESTEILLNDSSFDRYVRELAPDYVLFDRFVMEEQFSWRVGQAVPQALRILDTVDLHCLRGARQQALAAQRNMDERDLFSELAKREVAAVLRSDVSLIISEYEMQLLQKNFGVDPALLHYLPFMLDVHKELPALKPFSERCNFVTIGNFRHAPNWDSVLFLRQIWPRIRAQIAGVELHIYGAYPPKKATALNNPKVGFLIKGWADSAFEVLADARVCLSPLRFGAGLKGKLIDAMQMRTPSVTTDIGAEGMAGELSWPGIIANSAEEVVASAVALYQNESIWKKSQSNISQILSERYDAARHGAELIHRVESVKSNLEQHRMQNFIGGMLNHHLLKSTQYMSNWIETKTELQQLKNAMTKCSDIGEG